MNHERVIEVLSHIPPDLLQYAMWAKWHIGTTPSVKEARQCRYEIQVFRESRLASVLAEYARND